MVFPSFAQRIARKQLQIRIQVLDRARKHFAVHIDLLKCDLFSVHGLHFRRCFLAAIRTDIVDCLANQADLSLFVTIVCYRVDFLIYEISGAVLILRVIPYVSFFIRVSQRI